MSFSNEVDALRADANRFDAASVDHVLACLARLSQRPLARGKALLAYHETLLFLAAHPANRTARARVERELARIAAWAKQSRRSSKPLPENEGLPYADSVTRFSHDCVRWLLAHPDCRVEIESFDQPRADLNAVLALTLPSLERNETTAGLDNAALLDALRVPARQRLAVIVAELGRLDEQPLVKDHLFDALDLFVRVTPTSRAFAKAFNRLPMAAVFYQRDLLREFDARALMDSALPAPRRLDAAASAQAVRVLKNVMALTCRETDPATYLAPESLRLIDLERGLSVALFGMTPERQLPLEAYVGFTMFKNGLAIAYGGTWLLGPRANFGMNIFEPYRGGESGYVMCQVLRAYRQTFGIEYFEVDAHQFGLDNPDGIATGAFWFYYRYGFRPLAPELAQLAQREKQRIARRKGYRSSERTLLRFTGSNVALNFGDGVPLHLFDVTTQVTAMIRDRYASDRAAAERDCVQRFVASTRLPRRLDADQRRVLVEVALVAGALGVVGGDELELLAEMVKIKPVDHYRYQALLCTFFGGRRRA